MPGHRRRRARRHLRDAKGQTDVAWPRGLARAVHRPGCCGPGRGGGEDGAAAGLLLTAAHARAGPPPCCSRRTQSRRFNATTIPRSCQGRYSQILDTASSGPPRHVTSRSAPRRPVHTSPRSRTQRRPRRSLSPLYVRKVSSPPSPVTPDSRA